MTLAGTLATGELLERKTSAPPGGAALVIVSVPVEALPASTEFGRSDTFDRSRTVSVTVIEFVAVTSFGAPDVAVMVTVLVAPTNSAA